jgi:hypothetical protein
LKLLLDEQHARIVAELMRKEKHDVVALTERPALRGGADSEVLQAAVAEGRALMTENARDFALLHRQWMDAGKTHLGMVLTSPRSVPRRKSSLRPLLAALRALLRANPSADALRDQLIWLHVAGH